MASWQKYLQERKSQHINELCDFIRIPSISSLPENVSSIKQAAEWLADRLNAARIENIQILPCGDHPAVYGEWLKAPNKPTVLLYGHYDVQPADPIDAWDTPPF